MSSNNFSKREDRKARKIAEESSNDSNSAKNEIEFKPASNKPLEALNERQRDHKAALFNDEMVVAIGFAGTGKTYLSAAVAAEILKQHGVKKLILTRPNVEVGRGFGFLPGDINEKYAPYLEPFQDAIIDRIGSADFKCKLHKSILPKPLQFMRGKTFDDSIILLDEAQNTTVEEMKMFVTRVGINSRVFVSGDSRQCDLRLSPGQENGLDWLVRVLRKHNDPIEIIDYKKEDNVRSGLSRKFLDYIDEDCK